MINVLTARNRSRLGRRCIATISGVLAIGVGVAFFRMAMLGMDPFQVLMGGIDAVIPGVPFGTLWLATLVIMLILPLVKQRSLIGVGTLLNIVIVGYVIDISHNFLLEHIPNHTLVWRIIWLAVGIIVIAIALAFYITADLGVSAYDAITLIISEKYNKISFKFWRIICDSICLLLGVALFLGAGKTLTDLSALVGFGTIIATFGMGPFIQFFINKLARPLLA